MHFCPSFILRVSVISLLYYVFVWNCLCECFLSQLVPRCTMPSVQDKKAVFWLLLYLSSEITCTSQGTQFCQLLSPSHVPECQVLCARALHLDCRVAFMYGVWCAEQRAMYRELAVFLILCSFFLFWRCIHLYAWYYCVHPSLIQYFVHCAAKVWTLCCKYLFTVFVLHAPVAAQGRLYGIESLYLSIKFRIRI